MRHKWQDIDQRPVGLLNSGKRKCANKGCGKVQIRYARYSWGRITGYYWWPLSGKCKGYKS